MTKIIWGSSSFFVCVFVFWLLGWGLFAFSFGRTENEARASFGLFIFRQISLSCPGCAARWDVPASAPGADRITAVYHHVHHMSFTFKTHFKIILSSFTWGIFQLKAKVSNFPPNELAFDIFSIVILWKSIMKVLLPQFMSLLLSTILVAY